MVKQFGFAVVVVLATLAFAAPVGAQALQSRAPGAANAAQNPALSLPAGTKLMVRLDQPLDSSSAILGQSWTGAPVNNIPVGTASR